jgi:hypothetical protein
MALITVSLVFLFPGLAVQSFTLFARNDLLAEDGKHFVKWKRELV